MINFYLMLNVPRNARLDDIHTAVSKTIGQFESLTNSKPFNSQLLLAKLKEAMHAFSNPQQRQAYDKSLSKASMCYSHHRMLQIDFASFNPDSYDCLYVRYFIGTNYKIAVMLRESRYTDYLSNTEWDLIANEIPEFKTYLSNESHGEGLSRRLMQRALMSKVRFNSCIQEGLIRHLSEEQLEKLLATHDTNGSLRYAVIEKTMNDFEPPPSLPSSAIATETVYEQLKQKPASEIEIEAVMTILESRLIYTDFYTYINSNIWLVKHYWENRFTKIADWFDIIVTHPDYFKDSLLLHVEKLPLEVVIALAKANLLFLRQLLPYLRTVPAFSGKVEHELLIQYPAEFPTELPPSVDTYRILLALDSKTYVGIEAFEQLVVHAKLTHRDLMAYLGEHPFVAIRVFHSSLESYHYSWDDWIKISHKNPELAKILIKAPSFPRTSANISRLAKIDLTVANYIAGLQWVWDISWKEFITLKIDVDEINAFYADEALATQIATIQEKPSLVRVTTTPAVALTKKYSVIHIESYVKYLKKHCQYPDYIYHFLNQSSNKPLAKLLWNHPEHRQLLTQWDWTFLAMNNMQLAVSIRAEVCNSWHKFNINSLARLSENNAIDILSKPDVGVKLTRADLLELIKMYASESVHEIILNNALMLRKVHAAANYVGERGFENLAKYFLTDHHHEQALSCLKKAIAESPQNIALYRCVLEIENVSTKDLNIFLIHVSQAVNQDPPPSDFSQLIIIKKLLQARLLTLTGDDDYKSEIQRQFEEEEAELIEQDKLKAKDERFFKDICHALYNAAANVPEDVITQTNLFSVEEIVLNSHALVMNNFNEELSVACFHLTQTIIAYIRANNISADISISAMAKDIFKHNAKLREYIEKTYPDFYRQMQLQYPTYPVGQALFTENTSIVIQELTIKNILSSPSEGNNRIGNDSL